jgi:multimeric flavodoxin WrbA
MKALIINCTLKKSPQTSNTEVLAHILGDELEQRGAEVEYIRAVDKNFLPSPTSDAGPGDEWPPVRKKVLDSDILVLASPTWSGQHSSVAQRVIERLNGLFSEEDEAGRPPAYNHVAGLLATGNSDGAKYVISNMMLSLNEIGFTIPGQAWAFFNNGSAAGPVLTESDPAKLTRSRWMAAVAASNLAAVAKLLKDKPIPPPPKPDDF